MTAYGQKKEDKKDDAASPTIIVHPPVHASETASFELRSILFDTGRADFSIEGMQDLGNVRDYLRKHPGSAALAFAYTDTRGRTRSTGRLRQGVQRSCVKP